MRLVDKTGKWDYGKRLEGRRKNYKVIISYSESAKPYWYYLLDKDNYRYNSLWDNVKFENQEQCVKAAEDKIDELVGQKS